MKRSKARPVPHKKKDPAAELFSTAPVDIGEIREQITRVVLNRAVKMVETTVLEVEDGRSLPMKYLFEMVGLFPATATGGAEEQDSLARTLLQKLNIREEASPNRLELQTEVMKDFARGRK